ncbi:MAG: aminoglycoside phosphotransferase [Beijerinckiaceae bacterium]|nr:MAG: aminoglycoside phosphotransferase [Beijerinckiaceae bacterium]
MTGVSSGIAAEQIETQAAVFAFLADPATHGLAPPDKSGQGVAASVTRIETHGSVVFLAGADAYKIKRAVRFPFMDFSTLEKRRLACEHEIAVNRWNAPEIYLGTVAIRRDANGLHLGGTRGTIIEWAVHLRRFDETQTFDKLAEAGLLDLDLIPPFADIVAAAHEHAPRCGEDIDATRMFFNTLQDALNAVTAARDIFPSESADAFKKKALGLFAGLEPLLRAREKAGFVRLCHGDLHLRNIVLHEGQPLLFDAIEFDDRIATCDILYDFAFVLMDLWQRQLHAHASRLFNLYLWRSPDMDAALDALATLPLFLALRAAIRAQVTVALSRLEPDKRAQRIAEAQRFFASAEAFLESQPLCLIAIGGLSGSGKSTLAKVLAPALGHAPGAVHLRSDVERKRLFGVAAHERLPQDAYRPEIAPQVYERLRDLARSALLAGHSVIVDAVHATAEERALIEDIAASAGARFTGLWLDASAETLCARVDKRKNDASDATAPVVRAQLAWDLGPMRWQRLDAAQPLSELTELAIKAIG